MATSTLTLVAPVGINGIVQGRSGAVYTVASDGTISNVAASDALGLLEAGWRVYTASVRKIFIGSPLPADLISTSAAAIATNRALTIAAQPPQARKLQIRQVIVTAITAGVLTLIGLDQDGNAITEVVSLIAPATQTLKTANAYANLTSATVSGLVGGGDGTLGIGLSNDFGVPTGKVPVNFALLKSTKITKVLGTSNVAADDVASTATIDTVARTIAPTTVPAANGLVDYEFTYAFGG
jgi:hypothetical protein